MLEIYLCRHGQSVANAEGILAGHTDSPLNDIGKGQAQELGQLAKNAGLRFDHIYCSPLSRAKDTAKIIAEITSSRRPEIMDDLIERDFGFLTGKPYSEIAKSGSKLWQTDDIVYFLDGEGVETFPDCLKRAKRVLDTVHKNHADGKVLLVAHGDLGMMLFAAFHSTPWDEALRHFHFGNSELLLLHEDSKHKPHVFEIDQRGLVEKA
ncbi:MAG TPA: histidine phosphatase family protein [Candidatus Binatia bacterium]|nr:histidine phosphatase family protein [Candidatus Binatia bacterium]